MQESYVSNATNSWLESVERSLAQMKEYQVSCLIQCLRLFADRAFSRLPAKDSRPAVLLTIPR